MTGENNPAPETSWMSLAEIADMLDETPGQVKRRIDDNQLLVTRRNGAPAVPAAFFVDGELLSSLRGTIFVLHDAGFSDDDAIDWLLAHDESIGVAPIEALRAGRKSEVRRVAQTLG